MKSTKKALQQQPSLPKNNMEVLDQYGVLFCKDIVSKEMCNFLSHAMLRKYQIQGRKGDEQIPNALTVIDHELFLETLHEQIWPKLERLLGEELLPTYTYSRLYSNGDVLKKHQDRDACEISITVQLGRSHHYAWPIYAGEHRYDLAEGDGVIYKGCDVVHWRDKCDGPKDYYSGQAFFHFVKANGKHAKEFGDPKSGRKFNKALYVKNRNHMMEMK
jgi:hypothetical protein